jgi:dTDP-4-dehydrorhamnose 3,5-epimerase
MIFTETKLKGMYLIDPELIEDERGFFARVWCRREFEEQGLTANFVQASISFNEKAGTLRGMHYQAAPNSETKLVRCTAGEIHDVVIDLRSSSPTYKQHLTFCLSGKNRRMLYIPEGFAHGFQTMEKHTEVLYQMTEYYAPKAARGVRWNDPVFGIKWPPVENRIMSEKDMAWPDYDA